MRIRAVVALAMLLVPGVSRAQHFPRPRIGRDPAWPAPLPGRTPEPIARALAYRRLRFSIESYPLVSHVQSRGLTSDGRGAAWTMFGGGTHSEYRATRFVSATMDLTSSFLGSPVRVQTAELGVRLRAERSERRVYPFVDARVGYVSAFNANLGTIVDAPYGYPTPRAAYGVRYSRGFGGIAGAGAEYTLTPSISVTTAASVMRSRLTAHDVDPGQTGIPNFGMTSYRYTLGIRYNPLWQVKPSSHERRRGKPSLAGRREATRL